MNRLARTLRPTDHPARVAIRKKLDDDDTGNTVVLVEYRTDHPDYEGGFQVEVYDSTDYLILDEAAPQDERTDLAHYLNLSP